MDTHDGRCCRPNWQHITLQHNNPLLFVTSQWAWPQRAYVFYRIVAALYWIAWTIVSGVNTGDATWFIFLTNWALLTLTVSLIVKAATATAAWIAMTNGQVPFPQPGLPGYLKFQWVLSNLARSSAAFAVILFWAFEWDGSLPSAVSINVHAINLVFIVVDIFVSAQPYRFLHIYQSLIYGTVYLLFTVIYQHAADDLIYSVLDWVNDLDIAFALTFSILLAGIPIITLIFFALNRLRLYLNTLDCCVCRTNGNNKAKSIRIVPLATIHAPQNFHI